MAEYTDEQLAELREAAAKEAREQAQAAYQAEQTKLQEQFRLRDEQHQRELEQAARIVRDIAQPRQEQPKIDPDGVVTNAELARYLGSAQEQSAAATAQAMLTAIAPIAKGNRARIASDTERYPYFGKYAAEIDQLAEAAFKTQPAAMADPDAYAKLYRVVCGQHMDEILDLETSKRLRARAQSGETFEDYEEEDQPAPTRTAPPVLPRGDAHGRAVTVPSRVSTRQRLTAEQQMAADRYFDGDVKAYLKAEAEDEPNDILGFRGRARV